MTLLWEYVFSEDSFNKYFDAKKLRINARIKVSKNINDSDFIYYLNPYNFCEHNHHSFTLKIFKNSEKRIYKVEFVLICLTGCHDSCNKIMEINHKNLSYFACILCVVTRVTVSPEQVLQSHYWKTLNIAEPPNCY